MAPNALWWYGLAAVVVGVLFTVSDFVALFVSTLDDPGEEALTDAYAGWAALSLFTLALLQVALIGLYVPPAGFHRYPRMGRLFVSLYWYVDHLLGCPDLRRRGFAYDPC